MRCPSGKSYWVCKWKRNYFEQTTVKMATYFPGNHGCFNMFVDTGINIHELSKSCLICIRKSTDFMTENNVAVRHIWDVWMMYVKHDMWNKCKENLTLHSQENNEHKKQKNWDVLWIS